MRANPKNLAPDPASPDFHDRRPPLPRAVVLLGWVSFFADVSSEMVYPLIPLFVVGVLGSSATTLGGIEGAASLVVAMVAAWAGWHSDRVRRRVGYIRIGYGLPVLGKLVMAFAVSWPMLLAGRSTDRFGKGLRASPRDALIADVTLSDMRGRAFGFHRAMDTAGALLGILLAAGLLWWFSDTSGGALPEQGSVLRGIFVLSAALGLISLAITFRLRDAPPLCQDRPEPTNAESTVSVRQLPPAYWRTLGLLLVFSLANSSDAFLLLRASERGLSPWAAVLAYGVCTLTYALLSYPAGVISDRLGRWRVMACGWALYAVVYAGLAFTNSVTIWPLLALYGAFLALTDGVGKALVLDHAPPEAKGTALGIFYLTSGLTMLVASIAAGFLWDNLGPAATFGTGAAFATLAVVLVPVLRPKRPSKNAER